MQSRRRGNRLKTAARLTKSVATSSKLPCWSARDSHGPLGRAGRDCLYSRKTVPPPLRKGRDGRVGLAADWTDQLIDSHCAAGLGYRKTGMGSYTVRRVRPFAGTDSASDSHASLSTSLEPLRESRKELS